MAVIFLFIDGVGMGEEEESNPFYKAGFPAFVRMAGGQSFSKIATPVQDGDHLFKGIDATLDVEGLPQSGTGQTTLFTGENAAQKIGRHFGPFPHSGIKPLLREKNIFIKAKEQGKSSYFMNAYPDIFFERARKRNRWSCTTLMTKSADIPLNTAEDVRNGRALTAGITQRDWKKILGVDIPEISEEEAARRVLKMAGKKDLVLYEYYLTDKAGHAQDQERAKEVIGRFDAFLKPLIENKRDRDTIVLTSDHGNVEDLSVKTHTLNKVPIFIYGPRATAFQKVKSIKEVTPAILQIL